MSKNKNGNWFSRHKILTVIIAIIVIAAIASSTGGKKDDTTKTDNKGTSQTASKATPKIGEVASDGKFEFTIKSIKCGETSVSDASGYLTKQPQGQFCLLDVSVKNIGDKQQLFLQSDQKLLNAAKVEYSYDSSATLYMAKGGDAFASQINPGNTVEGTLVYDIPADQTPVTAELHDSSFSNGVKVDLQ